MTGAKAFERVRMLVVDDNTNMRRLLRALLASFGCEQVIEAANAKKALAILEESEIDIALIDYLMEPMDGLDLTRLIRDRDSSPNPNLPIIMITGAASLEIVARSRDAGVNEFLAKPVSAASLYRRLHAVIERPRPFVRAKEFFGPDRRRKAAPDYEGPERRDTDSIALPGAA